MASCQRGRCTASLPVDSLCIDCDLCDTFSSVPLEKKPDFVVLSVGTKPSMPPTLNWFIIEMKSKTSNAGEIVDQLQAGVNTMLSDHRFTTIGGRSNVFPIVLRSSTGSTHPDDLATLRSRQVGFAGRRSRIVVQRCGYDLGKLR